MTISLTINNRVYDVDVAPGEYLLDTLRSLHFYSVKRGCSTTSCGVCTVLIDNKPVPSCSYLSVRAVNKQITTVEGIPDFAEKLGDYMGHEGADQCGFCNSSLALAVYAMKQEIKDPQEEDIKAYLVGNLCRCTGYQSQHHAISKCLEDDK